MEIRVNRGIFNQLLLEMGVPEERTRSLKVIVLHEIPNVPSLSETLAISTYSARRNALTLHTYIPRTDCTKATFIDAIAHESCHIRQGRGGCYSPTSMGSNWSDACLSFV